ncbi:hypothetical protein [Mycobacterium spongiae]|nr:hypothetical protein [Mycobacterium spongiae]
MPLSDIVTDAADRVRAATAVEDANGLFTCAEPGDRGYPWRKT